MPATATATKPLKPITPGQIQALHAIGRRRGLTHEQLREVAGVASLKELSVVQASALLDRLQLPDHKADWRPGPPDFARTRGTIRPATERQRNRIASLFAELGWDDAKARGWLAKRHGIRGDLDIAVFSTRVGRDVILELEGALRKQPSTAGKGGDSESV
jgi:hypothetical protein